MYALLLFILISISTSTATDESKYNQLNEQLDKISEQLDRVELFLNNSINSLLAKIDDSNHDILHLIKSHHALPRQDNSQATNRPVSALLIIDVQNDFIDGSLALRNCPSKHNGEEVIPVINQLLDTVKFDVVVYSYDWHPSNHISFFDNLNLHSKYLTTDSTPSEELSAYSQATFNIPDIGRMKLTLWPNHCVQNTTGANPHPDLKIIDDNNNQSIPVIHVYKGTKPYLDSYSAFWDNLKLSETNLHKKLQEHNVTHVFLTGLATDWCVYSTGLHALEYNYKTFIIEDACRGVDEKTIKERLDDFKNKNGHVIQSKHVNDYLRW